MNEGKKDRYVTATAIAATVLLFVAAFLADWRENLLAFGDRLKAVFELLAGIIGLGIGFAVIAVALRTTILCVVDFFLWIGKRITGKKTPASRLTSLPRKSNSLRDYIAP